MLEIQTSLSAKAASSPHICSNKSGEPRQKAKKLLPAILKKSSIKTEQFTNRALALQAFEPYIHKHTMAYCVLAGVSGKPIVESTPLVARLFPCQRLHKDMAQT